MSFVHLGCNRPRVQAPPEPFGEIACRAVHEPWALENLDESGADLEVAVAVVVAPPTQAAAGQLWPYVAMAHMPSTWSTGRASVSFYDDHGMLEGMPVSGGHLATALGEAVPEPWFRATKVPGRCREAGGVASAACLYATMALPIPLMGLWQDMDAAERVPVGPADWTRTAPRALQLERAIGAIGFPLVVESGNARGSGAVVLQASQAETVRAITITVGQRVYGKACASSDRVWLEQSVQVSLPPGKLDEVVAALFAGGPVDMSKLGHVERRVEVESDDAGEPTRHPRFRLEPGDAGDWCRCSPYECVCEHTRASYARGSVASLGDGAVCWEENASCRCASFGCYRIEKNNTFNCTRTAGPPPPGWTEATTSRADEHCCIRTAHDLLGPWCRCGTEMHCMPDEEPAASCELATLTSRTPSPWCSPDRSSASAPLDAKSAP